MTDKFYILLWVIGLITGAFIFAIVMGPLIYWWEEKIKRWFPMMTEKELNEWAKKRVKERTSQ